MWEKLIILKFYVHTISAGKVAAQTSADLTKTVEKEVGDAEAITNPEAVSVDVGTESGKSTPLVPVGKLNVVDFSQDRIVRVKFSLPFPVCSNCSVMALS